MHKDKKENINFSLRKIYKPKLQARFHCPTCDEDIILLGTNKKICPICHTSLEPIEKPKKEEKIEYTEVSQHVGDRIVDFIKKKLGFQ